MSGVLGIVVTIPEPWGSQLDQHRVAAGDPHAHLIPAHLTLLGPVVVPAAVAAVEAHLAAVAARHRPFQVHLSGTATFRPVTPTVYVAVVAGAQRCAELAGDVRSGPLEVEVDFPYVPHVTIAHEVAEAVLDRAAVALRAFEARFPVDGFTLYEQGDDGRWRARRRFLLGAGA